MAENKSSRTKMLEEQPENFWQKLAAKFSKGLDQLGITQEEAYKRLKEGTKKQEPQTKMAKGGMTKGFKPCASCPSPAKCKAAGKCLAKGMAKGGKVGKSATGMLVIPVKVAASKAPAKAKKK